MLGCKHIGHANISSEWINDIGKIHASYYQSNIIQMSVDFSLNG